MDIMIFSFALYLTDPRRSSGDYHNFSTDILPENWTENMAELPETKIHWKQEQKRIEGEKCYENVQE